MPDTLQSVIIGTVSGLASAVLTYFSTRAKIRLDLAAVYDKELQQSRLDTYKKLWAQLEPLARYGRNRPVTYTTIRTVSDETRTWYFATGGIYLTRASRVPYFRWKDAMQAVLDDQALEAQPETPVPGPLLEPILAAGSEPEHAS